MANPAPTPSPIKRMTLERIIHGRRRAPDRILAMGVEGVGKSTFAAGAPGSVFLAAEDGIRNLDVSSFPEPTTWEECLDAPMSLLTGEHQYKTFVADTIDWMESLIHAHVCRANGWKSIEEPNYGKGFIPANLEVRRFLALMDRLRNERDMEIILLAHTQQKMFSNPTGPDYSRYEMKVARGAAAIFREWADSCLFMAFKDVVVKEKSMPKAKATSTGERLIHTVRDAAFDAKNRWGLPATMALDYDTYAAHRAAGQPMSVKEVTDAIQEILAANEKKFDPAEVAKIRAFVKQNKTDATKLSHGLNRLRVLADEKSEGSKPEGGE